MARAKSKTISARAKSKARRAALWYGYASGLERVIAEQLKAMGQGVHYETMKIEYQRPVSKYTPDFILDNGIIIETKGRFVGSDRSKHLLIKKQHGDKYDIRFVFSNSRAKLTKTSKTTYGEWCERHGFLYADKTIPEEWINEDTK